MLYISNTCECNDILVESILITELCDYNPIFNSCILVPISHEFFGHGTILRKYNIPSKYKIFPLRVSYKNSKNNIEIISAGQQYNSYLQQTEYVRYLSKKNTALNSSLIIMAKLSVLGSLYIDNSSACDFKGYCKYTGQNLSDLRIYGIIDVIDIYNLLQKNRRSTIVSGNLFISKKFVSDRIFIHTKKISLYFDIGNSLVKNKLFIGIGFYKNF